MPSHQDDQDLINFQQYWLIAKRRWLLIATIMGSVFGVTGLLTFSQKPIYEAEGKLLFNKQSGVSSLTGVSEQLGQLSGVTNLSNPLETEAEIIRSNPIIQKTIAESQLKDEQGQPLEIDDFLRSLKIKSVRGTDILQLTYRSANPEEATAIINRLMNTYLENNVRNNRSEATAAREFLSKQLPLVEAKVTEAEAALRRFKEKYEVVSLQEEAIQGVKRLNDLSGQVTQLRAQLVDARTRSGALQNQLALNTKQAMALSSLSQSNAVQQVLSEYQKVQDQLAVERSRFTEEHPVIANLLNKEQALKEQLEGRVSKTLGSWQPIPEQDLQIGELKQTLTANLVQVEVERLGLENQVGVLMKAFVLYQARLRVLPKLEQQQLQLQRQLQIAQTTYEQMLKRLQDVEVVENQNVGNARIVSEALLPKTPVSPRIVLNLALGGFLGFFLAIGAALLLEAGDKSVRTQEEAQQLLDYPLLGTIPAFDQKARLARGESITELPVLNNPYSSVNAAFEMLQINLGFSFSDKKLKVIVVSSCVMNEGKSFIAANLAVATAQMGRRVLLIDADMRRPRQHEMWQQPNLMGLSNVLVGQATLAEAAKEVVINLELLTSGTIPPNPAALLDSQRMNGLLQQAAEDYDYVIIDTPPLSVLADASIIGKMADGMLLVARPGVLNSAAAKTTKTLIEHSRVSVLGMVVNCVATDSNDYGYYYSHKNTGDNNSGKKDRIKSNLSKITGLRLL
ncbi:Lipopolysaccharide biosynthesis [Trichormus variabilis ATCC 29413]|uniref:non-specific protein-tyrosine kinase n=2 Tax=Anabaena variabilis TaxID=264691 RepID=Q3MEB7_TRIV2|nr:MULTISPECIES: polysaccharide biosynthesis tyrosine autokinase [Nostocaceae]ABA20669.1 Lipopolysaccharide biosynthesis [Trichormus variabilis ATCC 29413]MBC1215005.1 polysaccharide biosynthesis tyrosine autokinase [Trichormus variabilis ARAD]MBC1257767.1 polysaccharide biosynthesis tyrosine autokinase [Trichormus variabilis V5]MBC1270162.1 polysaccharide biosynthesis tyrosine autokinase [Trichormus variabilis FSR]MBC1300907.1 polysaccharide biosynthesis tyrosine autokinase [Trichormus variab